MLYKEVPASTVLPEGTFQPNITSTDIEKLFDSYFYQKGQKCYQSFRSSNFQSTSTFLKDVVTNLIKFSNSEQIDEQQKFQLTLLMNSINNLLSVVENIFEKIDQDQFNAIVCGTLLKHIKKIFP